MISVYILVAIGVACINVPSGSREHGHPWMILVSIIVDRKQRYLFPHYINEINITYLRTLHNMTLSSSIDLKLQNRLWWPQDSLIWTIPSEATQTMHFNIDASAIIGYGHQNTFWQYFELMILIWYSFATGVTEIKVARGSTDLGKNLVTVSRCIFDISIDSEPGNCINISIFSIARMDQWYRDQFFWLQ